MADFFDPDNPFSPTCRIVIDPARAEVTLLGPLAAHFAATLSRQEDGALIVTLAPVRTSLAWCYPEADALTGALGRAAFIERFSAFLGQGGSHALLICDVDRFKSVNDRFGHPCGDRVLRAIVANLHSVLRADDLIGRIGGDEFAIALKNVPSRDALLSRLPALCRSARAPLRNGDTVTVSIGGAMFPADGSTFDALYEHADLALYAAKRAGRNRFACHGDEKST